MLRLECTKAKDTGIMEPMAFQFMGVELPLLNDSGEMVTSAVLNRVEYTPPKASDKKPAMGKNQTKALEILKRLIATGPVAVETWREKCLSEGMPRQRFNEAKDSLSKSGKIEINNLLVTVCGRTE